MGLASANFSDFPKVLFILGTNFKILWDLNLTKIVLVAKIEVPATNSNLKIT